VASSVVDRLEAIDIAHDERNIDTVGFGSVEDEVELALEVATVGESGQLIAARLGGDEFAVVLAQAPDDVQLGALADKLVKAMTVPIVWKSHQLLVGASMGVARTPFDGEDVETLMSSADAAMYVAKQARAGGYRFHTEPPSVSVPQ
jgi:diguanylate cyclase (GGDEF)-like protein